MAPNSNNKSEARIPGYLFAALDHSGFIQTSRGGYTHRGALREIGPLPHHVTQQMSQVSTVPGQGSTPRVYQDGKWREFQAKHILPWVQERVNEISQAHAAQGIYELPADVPKTAADNSRSAVAATTAPGISENLRIPYGQPINLTIHNNSGV